MSNAFHASLKRDLLGLWREPADALLPLAFFLLVMVAFPLGVGAEPNQLRAVGPGVAWVAALLASISSLPRLFGADHADGSLEQWVLSPSPAPLWILGKLLAHWLASGLPLILLAPLAGLLFGMSNDATLTLAASLALGTPILALLGALGASLTLGARGGGMLIALLVLPLTVPVLVFGAGSVATVAGGQPADAHLALLAGGLCAALALLPWAIAAALRLAVE